jgi:hypothetical protein
MSTNLSGRPPKFVDFPYYSFRNISCPEDTENNRKVFTGHAPVESILLLPTDENVREYLLDAEGRQRRKPTQVHLAMRDTLDNAPHNFSVLNGGIVIVAREVEAIEKDRLLRLISPSIINGSQTQGVLRDFLAKRKLSGNALPIIHVKFELVVTDDEALIAETSISRNFQNDVMTISIAGRLGQLDELEEHLQAKIPYTKLQKSETKLSDDYVKTEKLLQVIAALVPSELWPKEEEKDSPNKVYTYSMKAKCLKDFQVIYRKAKDPKDPDHKKFQKLYEFYLDIAAQALELYTKWKSHNGFKGSGLRALARDEVGNIQDIPDGIVFPIIASLAAFAKKTSNGWRIEPPAMFVEEELVRSAITTYKEIARSDPQSMGKNRACYSALFQITSIYQRLGR